MCSLVVSEARLYGFGHFYLLHTSSKFLTGLQLWLYDIGTCRRQFIAARPGGRANQSRCVYVLFCVFVLCCVAGQASTFLQTKVFYGRYEVGSLLYRVMVTRHWSDCHTNHQQLLTAFSTQSPKRHARLVHSYNMFMYLACVLSFKCVTLAVYQLPCSWCKLCSSAFTL